MENRSAQGRSARKKKIVPHRHDISRISDSTISTSHSIRYEIKGVIQRCYDVIHTPNNGLAHSNCIVTYLQWSLVWTRQICKKQKIVRHRHDISRISDSTISTSHSIRYEIITFTMLPGIGDNLWMPRNILLGMCEQ